MRLMDGILAVTLALVMLAVPATVAEADNPPPPPPDNTPGVCCFGGGLPVEARTASIHRAHTECADDGHLFAKGLYDPTTPESPCDDVPGGD